MTILDSIVDTKRLEVLKRKRDKPLEWLKDKPHYSRSPINPLHTFKSISPAIIAEFKRKSPSKGVINDTALPVDVARSYVDGGATAMSILTDRSFFGGSFRDMEEVRNALPELIILRKDFIIDPYQLHEAMAYGADIILLIAAILKREEVERLAGEAAQLGLTVLLEVHEASEIGAWVPGIGMIGVNNRDLKTFTVDINRSVELFPDLPGETLRISESGLTNVADLRRLTETGYDGFLMGERFMKEKKPGIALKNFINTMNSQ